ASCTCSATTTPSPRSTGRCSGCRTGCSPSGAPPGPAPEPMNDVWLLAVAAVLVLLAGLFTAADAALASFSRARAAELVTEEKAGAKPLVALVEDPPRFLNTALFLRLLCEVSAIVLVTKVVTETVDGRWWASVLGTIALMVVISFVVIGVAPRTLG